MSSQINLEKREKNLEVAVFEAASIRLRPILMTSISTIIGVLPLILGTGPGAASRLTVGITIFGGMLFSTFFTLYVIPTVYTIVGKGTQRIDAVEIELKKQLKKIIYLFLSRFFLQIVNCFLYFKAISLTDFA